MPNSTASSVTFTITAQDYASAVLARTQTNLQETARAGARAGAVLGGPAQEGARKFQSAIANLALANVGATGSFGKLVEGASFLAIGSTGALAIIGGIGLVAGAIALITSESRKAKQHTDELIASLVRAGQVRSGLAATLDYRGADQQVRTLQRQLRTGTTSFQAYDERTGQQTTITTPMSAGARRNIQQQLDAALSARLEASSRILDRGLVGEPAKQAREVQTRIQKILANLYMLQDENGHPINNLIDTTVNVSGLRGGLATGTESTPGPLAPMFNAIQTQIGEIVDYFANDVGPMLADAISTAFSFAFRGGGIAGLFKGFAASVLASLGALFKQLGSAMIAAAPLLAKIRAALASFNPAASLAVGVALVALGSLLGAVSGSLAGNSGSRGGYSTPGGGFNSGGVLGGSGLFSARPGEVIVNFTGRGPDFTDPEERDRFARMLTEVGPSGTRQVTFHRVG